MEMPYEITQIPTEGKLFEVKPLEIDRSKFEFEKPIIIKTWWIEDKQFKEQESWVRQMIKDAFAKVDNHPERYASAFYTLIPEKEWDGYKSIAELKAYARNLGGLMANWVEQALEWAQRIDNGESWADICKKADTAKYYRIIRWKNGHSRLVGGSREEFRRQARGVQEEDDNCVVCASDVGQDNYYSSSIIDDTVPLVVIRK